MPGIVVGIDGSPYSELSLAWAMKEAALRQVPLTVLAVHQAVVSAWTGNPLNYVGDTAEVDHVRTAAEESVKKIGDQLDVDRPRSVTVSAIHGFPAQELIRASGDADLIVVGARGGGGFANLAFGSVSSQVASHAACPVVVVPHAK